MDSKPHVSDRKAAFVLVTEGQKACGWKCSRIHIAAGGSHCAVQCSTTLCTGALLCCAMDSGMHAL